MKNFLLSASILLLTLPAYTQQKQPLNILTFNIRYNNPGDGVNAWPNRKEWVKQLVQFHETDILCVQEALQDQVTYLRDGLNFALEGVGRDDGKEKGEYSAILYNSKRFKKLKSGYFWLSETPEKPSKGWDAQIVRICTWIQLRDSRGGKEFFVFNTHYDHMGEVARLNSSALIKQKITAIAGKSPVFLTGDMNATPETPIIMTLKSFMKDAKEVSKMAPYGPEGTFNSFKWDAKLEGRIDYIFVSDAIDVLKFGVLSDAKEQRYPSDHLPVLVKALVN